MSDMQALTDEPAARDRILDAAVRLFGRQGFDGTSLRALADEAQVSWGLIRFYFGSKEGLREAAEALVQGRYLGLISEGAGISSLEGLFELIDRDTHLPDDAHFLRRAFIEERPIAQTFLQRLFAAERDNLFARTVLDDFPEEAWFADPLHAIATRLGYLMLAPQIKAVMGRDVFSPAELKLRNTQMLRMSKLIHLGLKAERDQPNAD